LAVGVFFCISVYGAPESRLRYVRTIDSNDLFGAEFFSAGPPDLSGVGFPPGAQSLLVFDQPAGSSSLVLVAPPKTKDDQVDRAALAIADPVNIAFDAVSVGAKGFNLARLFLWDSTSGKLTTVRAKAKNGFDKAKIRQFDVFAFGVDNPQGLTLNPDTGELFVLDIDSARIVTIRPKPGHAFTDAELNSVPLPEGLGMVRGLAFNPADQHVYLFNTALQTVYKVTMQGDLVDSLAIADQTLALPQGLVFAPSLDPTDHPSVFHLFAAAKTGVQGEITEWALPGPFDEAP
jgi:hypothetical protein